MMGVWGHWVVGNDGEGAFGGRGVFQGFGNLGFYFMFPYYSCSIFLLFFLSWGFGFHGVGIDGWKRRRGFLFQKNKT